VRLKSPKVWIGILSAAAVLYLTVGYAGRESPGPLAAVHEREAKLTGWNSCAQCHGGWFGSMAESCLECHADVAEQIAGPAGLHGALGRDKAMQCARCHSDHHGADFAMVNRQSFLQAGVPDREQFDHAMVGFEMNGKHTGLACAKCHKEADTPVLPEGTKRFLGLQQDCGSCHEDKHEGRMKVACAKCHGQEDWTKLHSLGHEEHLPLVGGHGDVACRTCHAEADAQHSLEAVGGATRHAVRTCVDCHESPHHEQFVAGVARLAGKSAGTTCVACHLPEHTSFREQTVTVTPGQHAASGFALDIPHDLVGCVECHGGGGSFADRYPGRAGDDCAACHTDPHGGQFAHEPFQEQGCLACHLRVRWETNTFDAQRHADTSFPLTGAHVGTDCDACHLVPADGEPRAFQGTTPVCGGCHEDAHNGFFARFGADPQACGTCHDTATFGASGAQAFDHTKWTGFEVAGAHAQSKCESCHARTEEPDAMKRTFGRVAQRYGKYEGCATCHRDPHAGVFDRPGLPVKTKGGTGCARCHLQTSFRAFPDGFDHGRWTGFDLGDAHERAGCAACHAVLREPAENGRTWGKARGATCAACHADPHAGQFLVNGVTDCQRCHRAEKDFYDLTFRHNFDSRFRPGKAHAGVACNACHKPARAGDKLVVRYRPLGRECADCHDPQTDPLGRRQETSR